MTSDEIIGEIRAIRDELKILEVKPEGIDFRRVKDNGLPEMLESFWEQLKRRKEFLGKEKNMEF